jgi:transcriptional regulator GlxA family with amidase domain
VDVIGPLEAFGIASRMLEESTGRRGYETELVTSATDLALATSSGVKILAHKHYSQVRGKIDTLLISGGSGTRGPRDPSAVGLVAQDGETGAPGVLHLYGRLSAGGRGPVGR